MIRQLGIAITFILAMFAARTAVAGGHDGHGRGIKCPSCCDDCVLSAEKSTETKHCWEVETKTICIPRITFPWQRCGGCGNKRCEGKDGCSTPPPLNGAKSKCVKILVKHEYECTTCKYKFSVPGKGGHKSGDKNVIDVQPDQDIPEATIEAGLHYGDPRPSPVHTGAAAPFRARVVQPASANLDVEDRVSEFRKYIK